MSIYPTLCDLCGIETPKHVEGKSILGLLKDPNSSWTQPAITTYKFNNHAVRDEDWRYIRYANGDEELYHDAEDPYEWKNLAGMSEYNAKKAELAKFLPTKNHPDIGGKGGEEDFGDKAVKKGKKAAKGKAQNEAEPAATKGNE
jgi:arylsulfatase A-like enzyme